MSSVTMKLTNDAGNVPVPLVVNGQAGNVKSDSTEGVFG